MMTTTPSVMNDEDQRDAMRAHDGDGQSHEATSATEEDFEAWSKDALYARAKELGIPGRSEMNKAQLIQALRSL